MTRTAAFLLTTAALAASLRADVLGDAAWIAAPGQREVTPDVRARRGGPTGTSWFAARVTNAGEVRRAVLTATALGVFDCYVNGRLAGDCFLKPGFTSTRTRYAFSCDVTALLRTAKGEVNELSALVSPSWWCDSCADYQGIRTAFRAALELTCADGSVRTFATNVRDWKACLGGPLLQAGVFDGEHYDARVPVPGFDAPEMGAPVADDSFCGEVLPSDGAEVVLRRDLTLPPREAYCWRGAAGATDAAFGRVVKTRVFRPGEPLAVDPGETLVVDFGQNAAAVPEFRWRAEPGTVVTVLPAEMLNDANGEKARGNDGPAGSVYRVNLRKIAKRGARLVYTFGAGTADYLPRHTFFGYRYVSIAATRPLTVERLVSVPVTSIRREQELGRLVTGVPAVNRLVENVRWGQLSNYLSVPTDCPQRDERQGWTADTQVFAEAGSFNADTYGFLKKWMRDMRDSQGPRGGFPGVAPACLFGKATMHLGWADAGVIVPHRMFVQFGRREIVDANWAAMERFLARLAETRYRQEAIAAEANGSQYADWLSFEAHESHSGKAYVVTQDGPAGRRVRKPTPEALRYWDYLGGCYWILDSELMAEMAEGTGRREAAAKYRAMAETARASVRKSFFATADGMIDPLFRDMQTPAVFALRFRLVEGTAYEATKAALRANIAAKGGLTTGFLGTSMLMDTLTEHGMSDVAYTLLLNRSCPSWLYSVDQGATTIWERWNSYVKTTGFGPAGMNSFNHYAYGCVLAWLYRTAAGIAADPRAPGFANIVMKPVPDRRLGSVSARYRTPAGVVTSAWRYEGERWIWDFTVPAGATATVTLPGETAAKTYAAGTYREER